MPSTGLAQYSVNNEATEVSEKMAKAVRAWTTWNFEGFGYELGELFRDLVMLAFPQKYSVDASGRLRRYSQSLVVSKSTASSASSASVIIGGAAMTLLVALAVVRTRRSVPLVHADTVRLTDVEDGADLSVE